MKDLVTAAKKDLGKVNKAKPVTFKHDGREVTFFEPTSGQAAIMMVIFNRNMTAQQSATFLQLFFQLMDEDTLDYFQQRFLDPNDALSELDAKGGLFDIWELLMSEWSDRPTKSPSDYRPPRRATGRKSTAPLRGVESTSSTSRSRASSR